MADASSPTEAQPPDSTSAARAPTSRPRTEAEQLSAASSVQTLRFPRPQGSQSLANWISSSSTVIMQPSHHSDETNLTDSTYELISTDGESQDEHYTESIADSLDMYPATDDVQSLAGNEPNNEEESDAEEQQDGQHSRSDSIRYADEVLEHPSTHSLRGTPPPPASGDDDCVDMSVSALDYSIEFREPVDSPESTKISVSHTIRKPKDDEVIAISHDLGAQAPKSMTIAVRQTMSNLCLSTREPLRILYVGSDAAKHDIVLKVSAAVLASSNAYRGGNVFGRSVNGLFNILPISGFGSSKIPDVQLTESSDYQIKVECCTSARHVPDERSCADDGLCYSITIDNEKTYTSTPLGNGARVEPAWELPHIAIFYVSSNDGDEAEDMRNAAWAFVTRHGRPSMFISHEELCPTEKLPERWTDSVKQGSAHLCVEARSPESQVEIVLPIDLRSFLNIDARQMNRNLAYLTGLRDDGSDEPEHAREDQRHRLQRCLSRQCSIKGRLLPGYLITSRTEVPLLFIALILTALTLYLGIFLPMILLPMTRTGTDVSHRLQEAAAATHSLSTTCSVPTMIPTVTIHASTTKTVIARMQEPSGANIAAHLPFGGFLSDKAQSISSQPEKAPDCSIRVYSNNEILVKVPSGTKTMWLAKGAIDIDVWRGEDLLKSKLSTTDEGIIIEISKEDAYGVMNVSVVTTRRPKINETFAVDFGKPFLGGVVDASSNMVKGWASQAATAGHTVYNNTAFAFSKIRDDTVAWSDSVETSRKAFNEYCDRAGEDAFKRLKQTLTTSHIRKVFDDTKQQLAIKTPSADSIRDKAHMSLLKAQIGSKLWWLRVQGKKTEHEFYEAKAETFLQRKHLEMKRKEAAMGKHSKCGSRPWSRCSGSDGERTRHGKWRMMG